MPQPYNFTSPKTNKTYSLNWNKPEPPTPQDFKNYEDWVSSQESTANQKNIAAATPSSGKSHGAVADSVWNFGRDFGKRIVNTLTPPVFEAANSMKDLSAMGSKDPARMQPVIDKYRGYDEAINQNISELGKHPIRGGLDLAANTILPEANMLPVSSTIQDIRDKNYGGAVANLGMAGLGAYGLTKGLRPELLPVEPKVSVVPPVRPPLQLTEVAGAAPNVKRLPPVRGLLAAPSEKPGIIAHPTGKLARAFDPNTPEALRGLDLEQPGTTNPIPTPGAVEIPTRTSNYPGSLPKGSVLPPEPGGAPFSQGVTERVPTPAQRFNRKSGQLTSLANKATGKNSRGVAEPISPDVAEAIRLKKISGNIEESSNYLESDPILATVPDRLRPEAPNVTRLRSLAEGNQKPGERLQFVSGERPANWGAEPTTVNLGGEGVKGKIRNPKLDYTEEQLPSAPTKGPISRLRPVEPTPTPQFKSGEISTGRKLESLPPVDEAYSPRTPGEQAKVVNFKSGSDLAENVRIAESKGYEVTRRGKDGSIGMTLRGVDPITGKTIKAKSVEPVDTSKVKKGISAAKANLTSAHKTLLENPLTEPLARPILEAFDKKQQWIRATLDKAAPHIKGLGKADRRLLGQALDTGDYSKLSPELKESAKGLKSVFQEVHKQFPAGKDVGYITDYFTHMADEKQPGIFKSVKNLFKNEDLEAAPKEGKGTVGDMYEKGLGSPDSPYIKKRTGALKELDYDVKNVLPKYLESVSKTIFDEPAVNNAKGVLKTLPDSKLKELAQWYVKNYTKYDSEAGLHKDFNSVAAKLANTTARSVIDFNPGLHMLHLGEIPTNIWPELGTKYTAHGIGEVVKHPIRNWKETSKLGLIQGDAKPFAFRTAGDHWQNAAYFFNAVEKFVKGSGYAGAKKKFLDQGFSESVASKKALELTKDMTLDTSPPRQMKGLSNESNVAGGEFASKLGNQFLGVPAKIAEQMVKIATKAKENPKAAARMFAGASAMIYATQKGAHTFHLKPSSLVNTTALGAFGNSLYKAAEALYKGDYETAMERIASWSVPGGKSASEIYDALTDKEKRDLEKSKKLSKETRSGNPPINSARRMFDYVAGDEEPKSRFRSFQP